MNWHLVLCREGEGPVAEARARHPRQKRGGGGGPPRLAFLGGPPELCGAGGGRRATPCEHRVTSGPEPSDPSARHRGLAFHPAGCLFCVSSPGKSSGGPVGTVTGGLGKAAGGGRGGEKGQPPPVTTGAEKSELCCGLAPSLSPGLSRPEPSPPLGPRAPPPLARSLPADLRVCEDRAAPGPARGGLPPEEGGHREPGQLLPRAHVGAEGQGPEGPVQLRSPR